MLTIDTIGRAPNAKVDYKRMKAYALDDLGCRLTAWPHDHTLCVRRRTCTEPWRERP